MNTQELMQSARSARTVLAAADTETKNNAHRTATQKEETAFSAIFTVESVFKIIAINLDPKRFMATSAQTSPKTRKNRGDKRPCSYYYTSAFEA